MPGRGSSADVLPSVDPSVVVADFGTELVVLVPDRRHAHLLEPMWALLFDSCQRGDSRGSLTAELEDAMGGDQDIPGWIDAAISEMTTLGLLNHHSA